MWEPTHSLRPHLTDLSIPDDGPLGPAAMAKLPPLDITPEEATLLGYMAQRDDFDKVTNLLTLLFQSCIGRYLGLIFVMKGNNEVTQIYSLDTS